jgi:RNA polymerase sigma-70 factor (ECF subfamily)
VELLAAIDRAERRVLLASLTRLTGDLALAEDALQDALEAALVRWPIDGVPAAPAAWLNTTARRRALDRLRQRASHRAKAPALAAIAALEAVGDAPLEPDEVRDDQLRLVFTCCHPALSLDAQVALPSAPASHKP